MGHHTKSNPNGTEKSDPFLFRFNPIHMTFELMAISNLPQGSGQSVKNKLPAWPNVPL